MKKAIKATVIAVVAVALCIVAGLHMQEVSEVAEARGELAPKNSEYSLALDMSQEAGFFTRFFGTDPAGEYKDAFDRRARLDDEELRALGYSDDDIAVLRGYRDGERSFDEAAGLTTAVLDVNLEATELGPERFTVQYSWQWDKAPLGSGEAGAALSYYALTPESSLTDTLFDGATASVTYCASVQAEGETVSVDVLGGKGGVSAVFDSGGDGRDWARSGNISLSLTTTVEGVDSIGAVCTAYRYAHAADDGTQLTWDQGADLFSSGAEAFTSSRGPEQASVASGVAYVFADGSVEVQDYMELNG